MEEERRWGSGAINLKEKTLPSLKANRAIAAISDLQVGASVIDYGCGEGKLLSTVKNWRGDLQLSGIDVQAPLIESPFFEFALITNETCPFFCNQYDSVLSLDVLEHVPNLDQTLQRISKMLNPGGKLVCFVPMEGEAFSPYRFYRLLLGQNLYVETKSHTQAYNRADFLSQISKYFEIKEVTYSYHVLGTLLDSTFFALTKFKKLGRWFWRENSIYHPENKKQGLLNIIMEFANWLCYWESTLLRNCSLFSSGVHVVAVTKNEMP